MGLEHRGDGRLYRVSCDGPCDRRYGDYFMTLDGPDLLLLADALYGLREEEPGGRWLCLDCRKAEEEILTPCQNPLGPGGAPLTPPLRSDSCPTS